MVDYVLTDQLCLSETRCRKLNSLKMSKIRHCWLQRAPARVAGINLSVLLQPQKKKIKKDPTAKKRKQTNSSDEPDSKAAKTDGSDNSDSDNGKSGAALRHAWERYKAATVFIFGRAVVLCHTFNVMAKLLVLIWVTSPDAVLFLSEEGTEGESGEKEEKEGSRGVSNS